MIRRAVDRGLRLSSGRLAGSDDVSVFELGGETRRIRAAAILSGAAPRGFAQPVSGPPPLLAVQGTNDPINAAETTASYFRIMRRPKFLLWLLAAGTKTGVTRLTASP